MPQKMKVFLSSPFSNQEEAYQEIEEAGLSLIRGRSYEEFRDRPYTEDELIVLCKDVDAIFASSRDPLTRRVLEAAERLQLVVFHTTGVDRIDVDVATELGILVCNSPSVENMIGMAEATISLMLALIKRLKHNENILRQGRWGRGEDRGDLLYRKTVGIIGLGRIGRTVAHRLGPWGVRLLAYDPYVDRKRAQELGVTLVDLDTLVKEADFVLVLVVITSETRNLLGERELRMMKPTAFIINTARGAAISEDALVHAIQEGWIAGAALDAFWQEPLPLESPLRQLDSERVILTPHKIGQSQVGSRANNMLAVESLLKGLRGDIPEHTVNPEAVPRWKERLSRLHKSRL
jgi:D-3-phosphoglycerate dehydrogenase